MPETPSSHIDTVLKLFSGRKTSFVATIPVTPDSAARGSTARGHSEPNLSEVTVTKPTDVASPKLFLDAVAGKLDSKVTIKFTSTTKGKVETFLTYEMENTGLSHYSLSSDGEAPMESLSLNFTKTTETFTGQSGSTEAVGYDLIQMKTV